MEAMRTGISLKTSLWAYTIPPKTRKGGFSISASPQFRDGKAVLTVVFATFTDITDIRRVQRN